MSSIVRRNSNKSTSIDKDDDDDDQSQEYFQQMRQRRLSAPDIRRRMNPVDRTQIGSDQKVKLTEQSSLPKLSTQTSTGLLTRRQYKSISKSILLNV